MKANTLRKKSFSELEKDLTKKRQSLQKLRFKKATGELSNSSEISALKKDIARILTIFNEQS